jgi:beta-phosphoglucomutase family hydrolase
VKKIRALIFDMDGVIVDSNPTHRIAWVEYTRRFGIAATEDMQRRMYGRCNDEIVRDFLGEGLSDREVLEHGAAKERLYRELMAPHLSESVLPGLREFLGVRESVPRAVATNAESANLDFVLDGVGLRSLFRVALSGEDVQRPKPDPEIYLLAASRLGAAPAECIVFEDSDAGVASGVAAGMRVVGVSTTHATLPGAAVMIRDFRDPALAAWLESA